MKKSAGLFFVFFLFVHSLFAQNDRSTIRIRLSDGSPLTVTINGRDYQKTGRAITISDIPRKRQDVQVYKFRPYADGHGGKAELVYSGRIKLEKGKTYDCIVDVGTRKFRMRKVSQLPPLVQRDQFKPGTDQPIGQQPATQSPEEVVLDMPPDRNVSDRLRPLKTAMDREDADSKKLEKALQFVRQNTVTTEEVKSIADWIFFDDNRLSFVQEAYNRVTDKENYSVLTEVFTLPESRENFNKFLSTK